MSTGPPPPKRQGNRHNKETPNGAIHPASNTEPPTHGGGPAFWHQHQDPPPTTPTPEETRTTGDEPSRHRLLGTLLSSQRTDAHPNRTSRPSPKATVQTYRSAGSPVESRSARPTGAVPDPRHDDQGASAPDLQTGGATLGTGHRAPERGVRSSLRGNVEKITWAPKGSQLTTW